MAGTAAEQELGRTRILALEELIRAEPLSRSEVTRRTGLSPNSVTEAVNALIESGWVYESGETASRGGRPATLLRVNREAHVVLGVGIHPHRVTAALYSLDPAPLYATHLRTSQPGVLESVFAGIDEMLEYARNAGNAVLAISVSVPGTVESDSGVIGLSTPMGWENFDLGKAISERYNLPVSVENDANLSALAESRYGVGRGDESLIYVKTTGIGAGIILDGRIYRGLYGAAGEIGHMSIYADGERCICGNRGCLSLYASEMALELRVMRRLKQEAETRLKGIADEHGRFPTAREIMQAARAGDRVAVDALEEVADALAAGLNNMCNLFDISLFVIGGSFSNAGDAFFARLNSAFVSRAHAVAARTVRIVNAAITNDPEVLGSVAKAFEQRFGFPLLMSGSGVNHNAHEATKQTYMNPSIDGHREN